MRLVRADSFTSLISDLVMYLDHQDPGLRGAVARLVFRVLRGASLESRGLRQRPHRATGPADQPGGG